MKKILLIIVGLSCISYADFTKSNGIVTDSKTTLQWQDDYSDYWHTVKYSLLWTDALEYCEALELGSHTDWRLPNLNELLSIVDYTQYYPSIDSIFEYTETGEYWSSTTKVGSTTNAQSIHFGNRDIDSTRKSSYSQLYIRCVRSGE